jgi:hypothetical protein
VRGEIYFAVRYGTSQSDGLEFFFALIEYGVDGIDAIDDSGGSDVMLGGSGAKGDGSQNCRETYYDSCKVGWRFDGEKKDEAASPYTKPW